MKNRNPRTRFEESGGAGQIEASSDDVVNLAKFRKEAGDNFLGLGINGCSRKIQKAAINLGKFVKGIGVNLGIGIDSSSNLGLALNPTPLSSYHPTQGYKDFSSSSSSDHGASSSSCCAIKENKSNAKKKKKNKLGGPKRSRVDESLHPEPKNPPEELLRKIGPSVRPVFLYRKQLSESDTRVDQNRLFVNDRKKLMEFMTEEERLAVEDPKRPGIDVVGIDSLGGEYDLHTNKWESLDKVVVKGGGTRSLLPTVPRKGTGFIFGLIDVTMLVSACLSIFVTSPDHPYSSHLL